MIRKVKNIALFSIVLTCAVLIFSLNTKAITHYSTWSAPDYTENEELKNRMEYAVAQYPDYFVDEDGKGIEFGGATDCMSYARWVYSQLFDSFDFTGLNVPGETREFSFTDGTIGKITTPAELKNEFDATGVGFGAMIYFDPEVGSNSQHAMIVLEYNDKTVTVIHSSWGEDFVIKVTEFTWDDMMEYFGQLCWVRTPWNYTEDEVVQSEKISLIGDSAVFISTVNKYSALVYPSNTTYNDVIWSVENITGEADINYKGELTAYKKGTVKVTAATRDGSGAFCSKTVKIGGPTEILNLSVTQGRNKRLFLNWETCRTASGYTVYRSEKVNGPYIPIATIVSNEQSCYEDTVEHGVKYYYKVCAYTIKKGEIGWGKKCLFVSAKTELQTLRSNPNKSGNF